MIHVQRGDGVALLAQQPASHWDLVFLDPPYAANLFEDALRAAGRCVKPQGWIYLEAPHAWEDATLSEYGLRVYRYLKAGAVHAHLLSRIA
jgi:16S rRNA G966 N2-methylase RsmD